MVVVEVTQMHVPSDYRDAARNVWYLGDTLPMELGFIPAWIDPTAEMSAVDQIDQNYGHGGGWQDFEGFVVNPLSGVMSYPGDPAQKPIAMIHTDWNEVVWMYHHGWVTVLDYGPTGGDEYAAPKIRTARID